MARCAMMQKFWFITNPGSGSSTTERCEVLDALFHERGMEAVGRTRFPEESLPKPDELDAAGADTVVLFAGDGTINAAACLLSNWEGGILILPGGTMNLLAKALHGDASAEDIVHAAHQEQRRIALPLIEAGKHRAFVGLILGPAASWVHAREMVRAGRLVGLTRAVGHAWSRTFGRGVRVAGAPGLARDAQAIFIKPDNDRIRLTAVNARDWASIGKLGWGWVTGDWVAAAAVTEVVAPSVRVLGFKPVLALFDGEPQRLEPGTEISGGKTRPQFITTLAAP